MLLLIQWMVGLGLSAQVPDQVLHGFRLAYPEVGAVSWVPQRNRDYLAQFTEGNAIRLAVFDPLGARVATGVEMQMDSLPDRVRRAFNWPGVEKDVYKLERLDFANGKSLYRYYFLYAGAEIMYEVDEDGQILNFWGED